MVAGAAALAARAGQDRPAFDADSVWQDGCGFELVDWVVGGLSRRMWSRPGGRFLARASAQVWGLRGRRHVPV